MRDVLPKALSGLALLVFLAGCGSGIEGVPAPFRSLPTTISDRALPSSTPGPLVATFTPRPDTPEPTDPPPSPTPTRQMGRVSELANLRSGPGTAYPVVGQVGPGQALDVVACNPARDWLQLANGQWIFSELVEGAPAVPVAQAIPTPPPPTPTRVPPPAATRAPARPTDPPAPTAQPVVDAGGTCAVTEGIANIRTGPGTGYAVRIMVSKGNVLRITGKTASGDWLRVDTPFGQSGWILGENCR